LYNAHRYDIILTNYHQILNQNTRAKYNISTKNNIVLFDEAHNVIDNAVNENSTALVRLILDNLYKKQTISS